MSFINKNYANKHSLIKPIIILIAILLIVGAAYSFFGKGSAKQADDSASPEKKAVESFEDQLKKINPTGLDLDDKVKTIGDVEKVIAKWIEVNPQAVLNAFSNMEKKMRDEQEKNATQTIGAKRDEIFNDPNSPTTAPAGYDVTIVEFFDYTCGYCKQAQNVIENVSKDDKKIRVIYKEFPIMSPSSEEMAVVALAVNMVDPAAYKKFHAALMKSTTVRSKDAAIKLAKDLGVNGAKLEEVLKNDKAKIDAQIAANRALGQGLGVRGTPGFIVGEELIPGFIDLAAMKAKVEASRKAK